MTYFRAGGHYHRPQELNDRVRNGNAWCLLGKVTGKQQVRQPEPHSPVGIKMAAVSSGPHEPLKLRPGFRPVTVRPAGAERGRGKNQSGQAFVR